LPSRHAGQQFGQQYGQYGADPNVVPSADKFKLRLWTMLFTILGVVAVILAGGAVWLFIDGKETGAAIVLAPVTAIITGLLGLFAASPGSTPTHGQG
jgi:hypothetical protein